MRQAIGLEYDGSGFHGWQVQRQEPTIQACVEHALSRVAAHPVSVVCCGRTDTGVHAICQVAHFDTAAERTERSWVLGANAHLPPGISMLWARPVESEFHARFSAFSRRYRYLILNRAVRPALGRGRLAWHRKPLDEARMHAAACLLRGEHDFSAFRAAQCQARHASREIQEISVRRAGDVLVLDIAANGFLYHMVRNIAGCLLRVGNGEQPVAWLQEILHSRDRTRGAPTSGPEGLYFMGARYPAHHALPVEFTGALPQFLA